MIERLPDTGNTTGDLALALVFYGGIAARCRAREPTGTTPTSSPISSDPSSRRRPTEVWTVIVGLGASSWRLTFTRRALLAVVLDEDARPASSGIPVDALNALLAVLTAVTVVAAMRIVGVLLVAALMVLPVATSRLLARSFRTTMLGAVAVGVLSAVLGLLAARQWALAAGGSIVLVAAVLFALAAVVAGVRKAGVGAGSLVAGPH